MRPAAGLAAPTPATDLPSSPPGRPREPEMDVLRGLAIVAVVYIHGAFLLAGDAPLVPAVWFDWCVPVFLAVGSYLAARSAAGKAARGGNTGYDAAGVWRRVRRLAVPFLVWSTLYLFLNSTPASRTPARLVTVHFSGYGWSGQYYFILLFQLALVQPWLNRVRVGGRGLAVVYAVSFACFLFVPSLTDRYGWLAKVGHRPLVYWVPFIALGLWFARHREGLERRVRRVGSGAFAGGVLLFSLGPIVEDALWRRRGIVPALPYMQASVLVSATAVFVGAWLLARRGAIPAAGVLFAPLGRYSLGVFCLNPLVIAAAAAGLSRVGGAGALPPWLAAVSPAVTVPAVALCCWGLSRALDRVGAGVLVK